MRTDVGKEIAPEIGQHPHKMSHASRAFYNRNLLAGGRRANAGIQEEFVAFAQVCECLILEIKHFFLLGGVRDLENELVSRFFFEIKPANSKHTERFSKIIDGDAGNFIRFLLI